MRERIQKTLAARGVGSRRQIEAWIAAGRITVNGKLATPGQPVGERDDIRLDGRRLRLARGADRGHEGLAYHRPPQEDIRAGATGTMPSSIERLPKSAGRRWIPVSPLAARDGGLELFITDGELAAALTRRGIGIPSEFSVRVRGAFDESQIETALTAASEAASAKGRITAVTPAGGEGSNRWLQVHVTGLRPRDLRELFERCGLEANRILRTRFGPIAMDRSLARGRSRPLTEEELKSLRDAAEAGATGDRSPDR
ncbi:MAG TPA: S4 domain-containing protein [Steroidobacteraceae bacterium]